MFESPLGFASLEIASSPSGQARLELVGGRALAVLLAHARGTERGTDRRADPRLRSDPGCVRAALGATLP